jgi:hypothetical protein
MHPVVLMGGVLAGLHPQILLKATLGLFHPCRARARDRLGFIGAFLIELAFGLAQPAAAGSFALHKGPQPLYVLRSGAAAP